MQDVCDPQAESRPLRISDPLRELSVVSQWYELAPYGPKHASIYKICKGLYGTRQLGKDFKARIDFHKDPVYPTQMVDRRRCRKFRSRYRMGLFLGYDVFRMMPVEDLRKLHNVVRGTSGKRYYDLLPKGLPCKDLAAINIYLETIARVAPCPFDVLVRKGYWHDGSWRRLALQSVLAGQF